MTQPVPSRRAAAFLTAVIAAFALAASPAPAAATDGGDFVSEVNALRDDVNAPPVSLNANLDRIAVERGDQMADAERMEHDMDYVRERMDDLGVCWSAFGEIIAYNSHGTASSFVGQWFNSDTHREIMLRPNFAIVGGSWSRGDDGRYYGVMVFVDPCGESAPAPSFTDTATSAFRADIAWLVEEGITAGCSASRFCPKSTVTREQMASFLTRITDVPSSEEDWFSDDNTSAHEGDINSVAQARIASGCVGSRYCPHSGVTRAQMASFLFRALRPPAATRDWFSDDNDSIHEASINALAEAGITGGCATGRFCPSSYVTREQMAGFLHRGFAD